MENLLVMQNVYNIISAIFILYMCFRWATNGFANSLMKVTLFILFIVSTILTLKYYSII